MSISDRLGQIRARIVRAREGRHTDRYMVLDVDAPATLAALRAVLDLHTPEKFMDSEETCSGCDIGTLDPPTWPCATYRAIATALGEGSDDA